MKTPNTHFSEASYQAQKEWNDMMNEVAADEAERERIACDRAEYLTKYYFDL